MACLALAALLLAIDHQEYRALTRAGLRALARGALPLFLLASLHLALLDPPRWLAVGARGRRTAILAALAADVALALSLLGPVRRGAPPFFGMTLGVACVLAAGVIALLLRERGARRD